MCETFWYSVVGSCLLSVVSADRPSVCRISTEYRSSFGRVTVDISTDTRSTLHRYSPGRLSAECRPILGRHIDRVLVDISVDSVGRHYLQKHDVIIIPVTFCYSIRSKPELKYIFLSDDGKRDRGQATAYAGTEQPSSRSGRRWTL